jgi:hypothetical protein
MTGGAQTDYSNNGDGQTFVTGDVDVSGVGGAGIPELDCDPNVDADCGYGDGSDLFNNPIFELINEISDETCTITVTAVLTDESAGGANDGAIDVSLSGATAPSYSWDNDSITQDISGLSAGNYSLVVYDGTCVVDTVFSVGGGCTPPTITGTIPGTRCGTGTVDLTASASSGTINWHDASSGGILLGAGINYTTASISATTSYWLDTTDGGCTTVLRTEIIATVEPYPNTGTVHHISNEWGN